MIERCFDVRAVNEIWNDPAVRPNLAPGRDRLDSTALITDRRNICLMDEGGGAIFAWRGPGVYEGHSFFRVRGREAIRLGKQILAAMSETADLIWGLTPEHLRHARWFNRQIGFRSLGMIETPEGSHELFVMRF